MSKSIKVAAALGVVAGLGAIALPMGAHAGSASDTADVTYSVTSEPYIDIAASGTSALNVAGGAGDIATTTLTVNTNDTTGYTIKAKPANGSTTALTNGTTADDIAYGTTAITSAITSGYTGASSWTLSTGDTLIDLSGATFKTGTGVASNETTDVVFGVKLSPAQKTGTYSSTITYTAETKA